MGLGSQKHIPVACLRSMGWGRVGEADAQQHSPGRPCHQGEQASPAGAAMPLLPSTWGARGLGEPGETGSTGATAPPRMALELSLKPITVRARGWGGQLQPLPTPTSGARAVVPGQMPGERLSCPRGKASRPPTSRPPELPGLAVRVDLTMSIRFSGAWAWGWRVRGWGAKFIHRGLC